MERSGFNEGWTFKKRGGEAVPVVLPHDAMQTEARRADSPSGSGCAFYEGGVYEYEKVFTVPEAFRDKSVYFEFEGAYPMAEVWLNGVRAGGCAYGYGQFLVPGDGLRPGEENTLRVVTDNSHVPNSRWYSGAGLHRPVSVWVGERAHIRPRGVRVRTLSADPPTVEVTVDCDDGEPEVTVFTKEGGVFTGTGRKVTLALPGASLWSAEEPNLHSVRAVLPGGDSETARFGIRTLSWSARGFFVNGRETLLRGGCVHHDNGILGARSFPTAEWRRVAILKSFGFNAIRSAHDPASEAMLEACDALGMYVMDEGWDMWYYAKTAGDYSARFMDNWERDLEAMVDKDFNHPCVVMYSIGNEVSEPASERGLALAKRLVDKLHGLDPSRPVTSGANLVILASAANPHEPSGQGPEAGDGADSESFNRRMQEQFVGMCRASATPDADRASSPYLDLLDIAGYNYASDRYPLEPSLHPDRAVVGSETFPFMLAENWAAVEKYPYLTGDFMWTAWDYLGETGIGAWSCEPDANVFGKPYPWLLADTGAFDILGNDNAEAGLAAVVWGARTEPYIAVAPPTHPGKPQYRGAWRGTDAVPHWSWRGCTGNETRVEVYTRAPQAALYLNGRLIGRAETHGFRADFTLPYEPGELKAVALDGDGTELSSHALRSATGKLRLRVSRETTGAGDGLVYFNIDLVGENGEIECNRDRKVTFSLEGGELLAFGSARPKTESRFETGTYELYRGRAQAVARRVTAPVVRVGFDGSPQPVEVGLAPRYFRLAALGL